MSRDEMRSLAACLSLLISMALGACQSRDEIPVGPICPKCGPSTGGETGDFGGVIVDCSPYLAQAELAVAAEDGFDVSEFERRLARPIDVPMQWTDSFSDQRVAARSEVSVRGYEEYTRINATISQTSALRYSRLDQSKCPPEGCYCNGLIEVDVRVELKTLDGAVRATTHGTAVQTVGFKDPTSEPDAYFIYFNAQTGLEDVIGTLRFAPPPGEKPFHGSLYVGSRLFPSADKIQGEVSIHIDVEDGETPPTGVDQIEGEYLFPLYGVFASASGPGPKR
jgi:hypothetical protein